MASSSSSSAPPALGKDGLPAALSRNLALLSEEQKDMARMLVEIGQAHLFADWPAPGTKDLEKRVLLAQCAKLDTQYPGGLRAYVANAKKLLLASKNGENPFAGYTPGVPLGERLSVGLDDKFAALESKGLAAAGKTVFMLVAGGLGERLGYDGIKVALPTETATMTCYLSLYAQHILAFQKRAREADPANAKSILLPLCIMTSGDTFDKTEALLKANRNFGLADDQLFVLKQEKVPALLDNDARFALDPKNPFEVQTKPHGHGDVHMLLHQSGVAKKFAEKGMQHLVLFQDTNGLVFRCLPSALGVSVEKGFHVNSITVPRRPGEAVGAICRLTRSAEAGGKGEESKKGGGGASLPAELTLNVEYNQLDPLLRATVNPKGDVPAENSTFSPYPGNINALIFDLQKYVAVLKRTNGAIPEFVNPKYADESKTVFKKPTRLEAMMQDYPRLLPASERVGFTEAPRWICFSAVKNNPKDALAKFNKTGFAESACSGEADSYIFCRRVLRMMGANVRVVGERRKFLDIPTEVGARLVFSPAFGTTLAEIRSKFPLLKQANGGDDEKSERKDSAVSISPRSVLVLDGEGIEIRRLKLDGTLVIRAKPNQKVIIDSLDVTNDGWPLVEAGEDDEEFYRIRGYRVDKKGAKVVSFEEDGEHVVKD